jgi:hypothetical protein
MPIAYEFQTLKDWPQFKLKRELIIRDVVAVLVVRTHDLM